MAFTNPPTKVHNCRANVAYCDGHVAGDRFKDLFAETDEAFSQWNHDHQADRMPSGGP